MLKHLKKYDIILGSASPRREELLKGLDISFRILPNNTDESYPAELTATEIPEFLAHKKADAYSLGENTLLITADTIVWLDGVVYGKPADRDEARLILKALSGRMHQVITGVCVRTNDKNKVFHTTTNVYFARFSDAEIEYYLDHYAPYDKAGSYGVQEWIGYIGVERIEGSYFNVMGLPVQRLYNVLKNW